MKTLLIAVLLLVGCATVAPLTNQQQYEMDTCPNLMTDEMRESGAIRCRAMCSSEARDMAYYTDDCKCFCQPASRSRGDLPPSTAPQQKKATPGQSPNTQI